MEFKEYKGELIMGIVLVILLFLLVNPFGFLMLSKLSMFILSLFIAGTIFFASLIFGESTRDEREQYRLRAVSHVSYLIGAGILSVGIVVQSLMHSLDIWLALTLIFMMLGRVVASMYYKHKH